MGGRAPASVRRWSSLPPDAPELVLAVPFGAAQCRNLTPRSPYVKVRLARCSISPSAASKRLRPWGFAACGAPSAPGGIPPEDPGNSSLIILQIFRSWADRRISRVRRGGLGSNPVCLTSKLVVALRERTGAGMVDCRTP